MTLVARAERDVLHRLGETPWLFPVAIFSSAALVFMVEPLIGKLLLPALGGSPGVWNTTLAFFQIALLAGYGYAHLLQRIGSVRRQASLHLLALAVAGVFLPLRISGLLGPPWTGAPAIWLFLVLALSIGLPFALLSATAPLLQAWCARLAPAGPEGRGVYGLYAASNLGSLLALAAYPVVIEPMLGLKAQAQLWSFGYAGFAVLLAVTASRAWRAPAAAPQALPAETSRSCWGERLTWMLLAAAPSSLLLGVTAYVTADVASVPFLWVIPLELYLATFVIAFAGRATGPPSWLLLLQTLITPLALVGINQPDSAWLPGLLTHLSVFFIAALACHMTLAARRPPAGRLTEFYLWVSIGGVVGGSFNAFLAPVLFDQVWEYPAVLILAVLAWPHATGKLSIEQRGWLVAGLVCLAPLYFAKLALPDYMAGAMMLTPAMMGVLLRDRPRVVAVLWAAMALASEVQGFGRYHQHFRSFFGVVHLGEVKTRALGPMRVMVHGVTLHGAQAMTPAKRCTPTTYYAPATLIGTVFANEEKAKPALSMAVVGLGGGTVATFVRSTDRLRFFEIDPLVARLATDPTKFSFIRGCARGPVDIVLGDARLSLEREPAAAYDLLLIDAFSSDSIPTHLLTVEALKGYLRLIKPDGVVLMHLSNRNLSLAGPAEAAAQAAGGSALFGEHWVFEGTSPYVDSSGQALLMARDPKALDRYSGDPQWTAPKAQARAWTDDYTNVWGAMIRRMTHPPGG